MKAEIRKNRLQKSSTNKMKSIGIVRGIEWLIEFPKS